MDGIIFSNPVLHTMVYKKTKRCFLKIKTGLEQINCLRNMQGYVMLKEIWVLQQKRIRFQDTQIKALVKKKSCGLNTRKG